MLHNHLPYHKIPIISPGLIFVQKAVLLGLFSGELIFGRNLAFQNGFGLSIKAALNSSNSLKQLKTANSNSPWDYIREGLLSKGCLRLRFGGLILFYFI